MSVGLHGRQAAWQPLLICRDLFCDFPSRIYRSPRSHVLASRNHPHVCQYGLEPLSLVAVYEGWALSCVPSAPVATVAGWS